MFNVNLFKSWRKTREIFYVFNIFYLFVYIFEMQTNKKVDKNYFLKLEHDTSNLSDFFNVNYAINSKNSF